MNASASVSSASVHAAFARGQRRELAILLFWVTFVVGLGVVLSASSRAAIPYAALVLVEVTALGLLMGRIRGRLLSFVLLGTLPMLTALGSKFVGHACTPSGCVSLCAPLCALGGGAAGFLLSRVARSSERPLVSWALGASLIISTGAVGCACVGASGVFGMVLGLTTGGALFGTQMWIARTSKNS